MEYWNIGVLGSETHYSTHSTTPSPHSSKPSKIHAQPFALGHGERSLLDSETEERIAGDHFELAQLAQRRDPGVLAARWTAAASPTMLPAVFDSAQRMPLASHSSAMRRTSPMLPTLGMPVLIESIMRCLIIICASAKDRAD